MVRDLVNREEVPKLIEKARDLIRQKNYDEATKVLRQVIDGGVDETYLAFASFYLGEISRHSGKTEEAENHYKQAIQTALNFGVPTTSLEIFIKRGRMYAEHLRTGKNRC